MKCKSKAMEYEIEIINITDDRSTAVTAGAINIKYVAKPQAE